MPSEEAEEAKRVEEATSGARAAGQAAARHTDEGEAAGAMAVDEGDVGDALVHASLGEGGTLDPGEASQAQEVAVADDDASKAQVGEASNSLVGAAEAGKVGVAEAGKLAAADEMHETGQNSKQRKLLRL